MSHWGIADWPLLAAAAALSLLIAASLLWWGRSRRPARQDVFSLLGVQQKKFGRRHPAPVNLSEPISSEVQWRAIRAHARDHAYRTAVETVRARYAVVANPMLLPNTLRTAMGKHGIGFREAMIRVAENDDLM